MARRLRVFACATERGNVLMVQRPTHAAEHRDLKHFAAPISMNALADAPKSLESLLERWAGGDRDALDALLTHLYEDVHAIAVRQLHGESHLTIQPTALVHEVYLRLAGVSHIRVEDRTHFLSIAARVARHALVDEARSRRAQKRDGGFPVTLSDTRLGVDGSVYDALDIDDLLCELQRFDSLAAEIVTLRIFGGLSIEETALALSVSAATVSRRWASGKAWLTWELRKP